MGLAILFAERQILGPVVLFVLLASIFPISYIAKALSDRPSITASGFWKLWEPLAREPDKHEDKRKEIALQLQTLPEHLDMLYTAIHKTAGPNVSMVEAYWKNKQREGDLENKIRLSKSQKYVETTQSQYMTLLYEAGRASSESIEDLRSKVKAIRDRYWELTGGVPSVDPMDTLANEGLKKLKNLEPSDGSSLTQHVGPSSATMETAVPGASKGSNPNETSEPPTGGLNPQ